MVSDKTVKDVPLGAMKTEARCISSVCWVETVYAVRLGLIYSEQIVVV